VSQVLDFVQQPIFAFAASALLLIVSVFLVVSLWRAGKLRAEREAARVHASEARAQLHAVMDTSIEGVVMVDADGGVLATTKVASDILNFTHTSESGQWRIAGTYIDESMSPLDLQEIFRAQAQGGGPQVVGVPGRRGDQDVRWLRLEPTVIENEYRNSTVVAVRDAAGGSLRGFLGGGDEAQFRKAVDSAPLGVALIDLEWKLLHANRVFADLIGEAQSVLRGTPFAALSHPSDVHKEEDFLRQLYEGDIGRFTCEKRLVRSDGNVVWTVLDVALMRHSGGAPDAYVVHVRDTTEARMRSELMEHRAMHDPLTGLANRNRMVDLLEAEFRAAGDDAVLGLLVCDLDGFKGLNDRYGHVAGDAVLVHVAGVLRRACGDQGIVSRVGGDEFIIVMPKPEGIEDMQKIAAAIHEGLRAPMVIKRKHVTIRASIGVAMATPAIISEGPSSLIAAADTAMYRAKSRGSGRTETFEPDMRRDTDMSASLARDVRHLIDRGELTVFYQPVVGLSDRTVVGFEALVRWKHPEHGLLLPGDFLPLLGDRELSVQLGLAVVDQVADFLSQVPHEDAWVSINVGADQLGDSQFADKLLSAISRHGMRPHHVVVELTEASLVNPNTRIRHELTELRNAGVPILLDDFGTGVSPLSYLRDLPVSGLKLDMSFTAGIPEDPAGARVSRALGALARELGLTTIAEGIETESQAEYLYSCGWDFGQGWLFGVPETPKVALNAVKEYSSAPIAPRPEEQAHKDS